MRNIALLAIVFCLAFSCNKKKPAVEQPPTVEQQPEEDNIAYRKIEPNLVINTASGYSAHPAGFQIVLPIDTSCVDSLKSIDFPDFSFFLGGSNHYKWVSMSNPNANYNLAINIAPTVLTDSIILSGVNARLFSEGDVIKPGLLCGPNVFVRANGGYYSNIGLSGTPAGEHYFGFKKTRGGVVNFGWIRVETFQPNGVRVKEIAINKTHNRSIRCGQKE